MSLQKLLFFDEPQPIRVFKRSHLLLQFLAGSAVLTMDHQRQRAARSLSKHSQIMLLKVANGDVDMF